MARKKRLIIKQHEVPTVDVDGQMFVPRVLRNHLPLKSDKRQRWRDTQALAYPTPNGYGDPLSVYLLVATLSQLEPEQTIRAAGLTKLLTERHPQMRWDSVTVGRILSNLQAIGVEWAQQYRKTASPMERRTSRSGPYYYLWNSVDTWQFLHILMDHLQRAANEHVRWAREGIETPPRLNDLFEDMVAA